MQYSSRTPSNCRQLCAIKNFYLKNLKILKKLFYHAAYADRRQYGAVHNLLWVQDIFFINQKNDKAMFNFNNNHENDVKLPI